jgi:hypothetical protein
MGRRRHVCHRGKRKAMKSQRLIAILAALGFFGTWGSGTLAAEAASPRLYEMTTQTSMPHLDENLRYAVVTEQRCLNTHDLSGAFWMLEDVSLQDCKLVKATEEENAASYKLKCHGGHGTTGDARWQLGPDAIAGTLNVRLGGKNMTFYQRITAKPLGACR